MVGSIPWAVVSFLPRSRGEKKLTNLEDIHKTRTRTQLRLSLSTSISKHRSSQIARLADRRGGEQRRELAWLEFYTQAQHGDSRTVGLQASRSRLFTEKFELLGRAASLLKASVSDFQISPNRFVTKLSP